MSGFAVECVIPILRVESLQRSLAFYQEVLGFGLEWETATLAAVSRDGRQLMLCEGDHGQPGTWVAPQHAPELPGRLGRRCGLSSWHRSSCGLLAWSARTRSGAEFTSCSELPSA